VTGFVGGVFFGTLGGIVYSTIGLTAGSWIAFALARRLVAEYIEHYNTVRLHSSIGYIAPVDKLYGRDTEIFKERDQKLEAARDQRRIKRQQASQKSYRPATSGYPLTQPVA
jgi:hypothetical protein